MHHAFRHRLAMPFADCGLEPRASLQRSNMCAVNCTLRLLQLGLVMLLVVDSDSIVDKRTRHTIMEYSSILLLLLLLLMMMLLLMSPRHSYHPHPHPHHPHPPHHPHHPHPHHPHTCPAFRGQGGSSTDAIARSIEARLR